MPEPGVGVSRRRRDGESSGRSQLDGVTSGEMLMARRRDYGGIVQQAFVHENRTLPLGGGRQYVPTLDDYQALRTVAGDRWPTLPR